MMPGQALGELWAVGAMQPQESQAMVTLPEARTSPCSGKEVIAQMSPDPRLVKWDTTPAMPCPPPWYGSAFLQGAKKPSPGMPASHQPGQESGSVLPWR